MSDCARCGGRDFLCQQCKMEEQERQMGVPSDHFETADEVDVDDDLDYECTSCGHRYSGETPCPECRSYRRRYVGPLDDESPVATDGGVELVPATIDYGDLVGAECPCCGEEMTPGGIRWTGRWWEHKSDDAHGQAGHHQISEILEDDDVDDGQLVTDGGTDRRPDDTVELRIRADRVNLAGIMSTYEIGVAEAPTFGAGDQGDQILESVLEGMESVYPIQTRTKDLRNWSEDHDVTPDVDVDLVELEDDPVTDVDDDDGDDRDGAKIPIADGGQTQLVDEDPFGIGALAKGDEIAVKYETPRSDYPQTRTGTVMGSGTVEREYGPTGSTEIRVSGGLTLWPAWDEIRSEDAGRLGEIVEVRRVEPDGGVDDEGQLVTDGGTCSVDSERGYLCLYCGRIRNETMFDQGNDRCHECIREGRSERIWNEADDGLGYVEPGDSDDDIVTDGGVDHAYLSDEGPHKCDICELPFVSIDGLANHVCIPTDGAERGPMPASTGFRGPADPPEEWTGGGS